MEFLTLFLSLLPATVRAVDLLAFNIDKVCDTADSDYVACSDFLDNSCCTSKEPFCETFILSQIGGSFDHYAMTGQSCQQTNGGYSYADDTDPIRECIDLPSGASRKTCSFYWRPQVPGERQTLTPNNATGDMKCQEPNKMVYHNGTAVREIYLPNGTFQKAMDDYVEKNYTALGAFQIWTNSNV